MSDVTNRIPLDRRVLVVREERIDLRPERAAVLFPLVGLLISFGLFAIVALFADDLSVTALALILMPGLLLAPFSAMGLVYSVIGASVVIETKKQSVRFQQGVLGLGIGTMRTGAVLEGRPSRDRGLLARRHHAGPGCRLRWTCGRGTSSS